ncbi:MAG: hypothetical protein ACK559_25000, partial [bacterium]
MSRWSGSTRRTSPRTSRRSIDSPLHDDHRRGHLAPAPSGADRPAGAGGSGPRAGPRAPHRMVRAHPPRDPVRGGRRPPSRRLAPDRRRPGAPGSRARRRGDGSHP